MWHLFCQKGEPKLPHCASRTRRQPSGIILFIKIDHHQVLRFRKPACTSWWKYDSHVPGRETEHGTVNVPLCGAFNRKGCDCGGHRQRQAQYEAPGSSFNIWWGTTFFCCPLNCFHVVGPCCSAKGSHSFLVSKEVASYEMIAYLWGWQCKTGSHWWTRWSRGTNSIAIHCARLREAMVRAQWNNAMPAFWRLQSFANSMRYFNTVIVYTIKTLFFLVKWRITLHIKLFLLQCACWKRSCLSTGP